MTTTTKSSYMEEKILFKMFYAICDRLMEKHEEQNISDFLLAFQIFFLNRVQMESKRMWVLKFDKILWRWQWYTSLHRQALQFLNFIRTEKSAAPLHLY